MSIGKSSSQIRSVVLLLDKGAGTDISCAEILDPSWLNSIRQCDIPDIRRASDSKLKVSVTITLDLLMDETRTQINFGAVDILFVLVLLAKTHVDRFIKSIHPDERNIGPNHPYLYRN